MHFAVEKEQSISARRHGRALDPDEVTRGTYEALTRTPHLPFRDGGVGITNGSRCYVDHGEGPRLEVSIAEQVDPDVLAAYSEAQDRIVWQAAQRFQREAGLDEIRVFKTQVDYASAPDPFRAEHPAFRTIGFHENYSIAREPSFFFQRADLLAYLATRPLFAGAGAFAFPACPGIRFALSGRAFFLVSDCSRDNRSTTERPLYHMKLERLGDHHRVHLICGEDLCAQKALALSLGATALVIAFIEDGGALGIAFHGKACDALKAVALDPELKTKHPLRNGSSASAIQVQRAILDKVERWVEGSEKAREAMPWARLCCARWRRVLELFERGCAGRAVLARELDWPLKLEIFTRYISTRDPPWTWEEVAVFNGVYQALWVGRERIHGLGIERVVRDDPLQLKARVADHGCAWERLTDFARLVKELYALDLQFGMRPDGLFEQLAPGLATRVAGEELIERAMVVAPPGRAEARGRWVGAHAGKPGYAVGWQYLIEPEKVCYLPDPSSTEGLWLPACGEGSLLRLADLLPDPGHSEEQLRMAYRESLSAVRNRFNPRQVIAALHALAQRARRYGRNLEMEILREILVLAQDRDLADETRRAHENLGLAFLRRGDPSSAAASFGRALDSGEALWDELEPHARVERGNLLLGRAAAHAQAAALADTPGARGLALSSAKADLSRGMALIGRRSRDSRKAKAYLVREQILLVEECDAGGCPSPAGKSAIRRVQRNARAWRARNGITCRREWEMVPPVPLRQGPDLGSLARKPVGSRDAPMA